MPNTIKYSTTGDTQSIRKGFLYLGVGDVAKGPSNVSDHYQGISPPSGGWTIYSNTTGTLTTIYCPNNDFQLINFTQGFSGQVFASATAALNWFSTQTNFVCVNRDYESIITSGLTFCIDAGFTPSYTSSGTSWYNVSTTTGTTGALVNGPTFDSGNGGSIVFDGSNDLAVFGSSSYSLDLSNKSFCAWVKLGSTLLNPTSILDKDFDNGPSSYGGWAFWVTSTRKLWFWNTPNQDIIDNGTLTIGTNVWSHIAITYNASTKTASFYINGSLNSSGSNNSINEVSSGTQGLAVGVARYNQPNQGGYVNGNIANILAYNRVLSATEVLQNYNAQKSRFGL